MKTRICLLTLAILFAAHADVYGLTPPSDSDGPIKLLACVVTPTGVLEAEVDNQTDDSVSCNIRCNYELGSQMFSHWFSVTVPARFQGRVGRYDTVNARAGNYSGDVGTCKKGPR
jgi:hypothetical protein